MADIKDLDLYGLLELTIDSSEQEIRTAYRKKALKCHPDKNPDDKKAIETFHLLSKAIEVLLDKSARAAYDSVIRRKEEVKIRNSKLDSTRKKFKEDLERREREAESERHRSYKTNKSEEEILQEEIERLRKEGSIRLQEEIKLMEAEINAAKEENELNAKLNPENYRLRIKWSKSADSSTDSPYNQESLTKIFSKYGPINILVVSTKKSGSALLEFMNADAAKKAKRYELGLPGNPLQLIFLNPEIEKGESKTNTVVNDFSTSKSTKTDRNDHDTHTEPNSVPGSTNVGTNNLFPSVGTNNLFPSVGKGNGVANANLFPASSKPELFSSSNPTFPSSNPTFPSSNPTFRSSNPTFRSSNPTFLSTSSNSSKPTNLFPSASESSNIFSNMNNSSIPFPSQLFLSSNVASENRSRNLVRSKNSQDIDYEQAVLSQMRKAQEKQSET